MDDIVRTGEVTKSSMTFKVRLSTGFCVMTAPIWHWSFLEHGIREILGG